MENDKITRLLEREGTGISWTDLTFNPWIGCQKVSPACDHCYAESLATTRLGVGWGPGAKRRRTAPGNWQKPPRWHRLAQAAGVRLKVFCASLADVFDNAVDDQWRADLAALIIATPSLDWMLLTKRIGNARAMLTAMFPDGVPPNVALGVTIANQEEANRDLPKALSVKLGLGIQRLFVSAEPLLGPLDLTRYLERPWHEDARTRAVIDLLIVGGESGKGARPMEVDWVRALRDQCAATGAPFHFKQWGEWLPGGQGNPHGVDLNRYDTLVEGTGAKAVEKAYRVGANRSGHRLDRQEHREHFQ